MKCSCCDAEDDGQVGDTCDACAEGWRCPECGGCDFCCDEDKNDDEEED